MSMPERSREPVAERIVDLLRKEHETIKVARKILDGICERIGVLSSRDLMKVTSEVISI